MDRRLYIFWEFYISGQGVMASKRNLVFHKVLFFFLHWTLVVVPRLHERRYQA